VRLEIGDHFVASVTPAFENAKGSWDIYLTDPTTVIPVVDGALRPAQDAPEYQAKFDGISVNGFASAIAARPTSTTVDGG
jgi:hypothetical protein